MTVRDGPVFDWRRSGLDWDRPPYEAPSPNLVALTIHLRYEFGGGSMGIEFDRDTTSGVQSEHSWGAALDHGTGPAQTTWLRSVNRPTGPTLTRAQHFAMVDFVVANSQELHVQSIVDIGRSWRSDRIDNGVGGWQPYESGYTGHAHFVTTLDGWDDDTPIADRLKPPPEPGPELPKDDKQMLLMKHPTDPHLFAVDVRHIDAKTRDALAAVGVTERVVLTDAQLAVFLRHLGK